MPKGLSHSRGEFFEPKQLVRDDLQLFKFFLRTFIGVSTWIVAPLNIATGKRKVQTLAAPR